MTIALMRKGGKTVKLRQVVTAGSALAMMAGLVAGCSSSPSSSTSSSSTPSSSTGSSTSSLQTQLGGADIAYTGSTDMLAYIKSGWFAPFKPSTLPPASQLAAESYGPGNNFFGFTVGLSGMLYNTSSVQASQVPTTWTGLLNSQWKNKLVMYDPTAIGEMDDIFAHLALVPGDSGLMTGLKAQNPELSPSSDITGPLTAVADGAKSLGIGVPYAFYLVAKASGAPVAFYLLNADNYTVTLYGGIVKGAPDPLAAQLYEDWMYTPQAATAIASEGEYSTVLADAGPAGVPTLTAIKGFPNIPLSGIPAADGAAITQAQHVYG